MSVKSLRVCPNGHRYYKSSDCPVCPICEANTKPQGDLLAQLGAPARRALENNGIKTVEQLAQYTEKDILAFHGIGPASLPKLKKALMESGLDFAK